MLGLRICGVEGGYHAGCLLGLVGRSMLLGMDRLTGGRGGEVEVRLWPDGLEEV
jgi:hypothetical protein